MSQKGFVAGIQGCTEHAVLTREMIAHAKRNKKNLHMVQIDFSNAFGSVPQGMIEWNMQRMGIPADIIAPIMDIYDGCETVIVTPGGESTPIPWTSGTVQGCPLSPALFNICLEPFLRAMEREDFERQGFPIMTRDRGEVRVNSAAYADDLILYSDTGDGIRNYLDLLAMFCSYTGMRINVKKCVSLAELWDGDDLVKADDPFYYRTYEGMDPDGAIRCGEKEQIPVQNSSLYLGTTIVLNREDEAKHGKHIIYSMKENIGQIGRSHLNITQKLHAIKTFELPRIDFRMMCGDIYQSDLRDFDRWLRGQIMGWPNLHGMVTEIFQMSWRDGGFTLPSLEERQHTMVIRTILDMMSTTDRSLLAIMRQFEEEEAERYGCTIVERQNDMGGFLRWEGELPDLRSLSKKNEEGDKDLHMLLREDLSIFPRALKATQELGLAIWMNDVTPRLRHKGLSVDFASSKISRPAMWITQEVIRKLALNSFKTAALSAEDFYELENNPSSNYWMN
jgi:hypothetical protein